MPEKSQEIAEWLRKQADERIKQARARRSDAASLRGASRSDLVEGKRLAEKMAGRRLNVQTSTAAAGMSAKMDESIAGKLEEEAQKLHAWANFLDGAN